MAYLANDPKKRLNQGQEDGPMQASSSPLGNQGGTLNAGSSGITGQQGGSGGQSYWTNIQSYLKANEGNNASSRVLKDKVGGTFESEAEGLMKSSQETAKAAQDEKSSKVVSQDKASQLIQQAGENYSYTGEQNDAYQQAIQGMQAGLNAQYAGPENYAYGFGADTQQYGQNIGDTKGFDAIMQALYQQEGGGRFGTGKAALQKQLDRKSDTLQDTREELGQEFQALSQERDQSVADVNQQIQDARSAVEQSRGELGGLLTSGSQGRLSQLQAAVDEFNAMEAARAAGEGKYDAGGPRGMQTLSGSFTPEGGVQWDIDVQANADDFYKYHPGSAATLESVAGQEDVRNQYNAIMDALGLGGAINDVDDAQLGNWYFDKDALDAELNRLYEARKKQILGNRKEEKYIELF